MIPWDLVAPVVVVAAAAVIAALERRFPYDRRQKFLRDGFFDDLIFYALVQSYVVGKGIEAIVRAVDGWTGASDARLMVDWPLWAQVAFFLVTHDLYIYLFHRLQHRLPLLWRLHEAHHSTRDVDWLSGSRSHSLEILINQTVEFAPLVLLGASPELVAIKLGLDGLWGMYIHSNLDVRPSRLSFFLNGPEMHRWHHATEVIDINFATKLALWDWIFGTAYLPGRRKPRGYGLLTSDYPDGYWRQQVAIFPWGRTRSAGADRRGPAKDESIFASVTEA